MKKMILFIQGGGEGAYEEDGKLVASLRDALGAEYHVHYPQMPGEKDPEYEFFKAQISKELASLDGPLILVGHSLGGTVLLRYLTEVTVQKTIDGIFLVAAPYWGVEDWLDEHILSNNLAAHSSKSPAIFFYHSRDDEVVPFAHLAMYAEKFPQGNIREFDGRGHQCKNDMSEIAADIADLQAYTII